MTQNYLSLQKPIFDEVIYLDDTSIASLYQTIISCRNRKRKNVKLVVTVGSLFDDDFNHWKISNQISYAKKLQKYPGNWFEDVWVVKV